MGTRRAAYLAQAEAVLEVDVCDADVTRASAVPNTSPVAWSDALQRGPYDAAVIATPPDTHVEIARQLIRQDVGALLIEKPLSSNLDFTETLVAEAARAGTVTMMGQSLRWHKDMQELRGMVAKGDLGTIVHISAHFGHRLEAWKHPDPVGTYTNGALVDAATHELDLVTWMADSDVEWIMGDAWRTGLFEMDDEDVADVVMGLHSGTHATVHVDLADLTYRRTMVIVGGRTTAEWSWRDDDKMYDRETRAFLAAAQGAELPHNWPDVARGYRVLKLALAARQSDGRAVRI